MAFKFIEGEPPKYRRKPGPVGADLLKIAAEEPGAWAELRVYSLLSTARHNCDYFIKRYGPEGFEFQREGRAVFARFIGKTAEPSAKPKRQRS